MAVYKLIKNNEVVNTIIADEVDSIRDQYDEIIEVIVEVSNQNNLTASTTKVITTSTVRDNLTIEEKVKWDNDASPNIITAKIEFSTPKSVEEAQEILNFLVQKQDISKASADKIIASVS